MRRAPVRAVVLALAFAALVACSDDDTLARWSELTSSENPAVGAAASDVGDLGADGRISVRFGDDCGQLVVDDQRSPCPAYTPGSGQLSTARVDDLRIVWHVWRSDPTNERPRAAAIDHAVVWSSASPDGREIPALVEGDLQQIVWVMAEGEEPWGVQLIDARGRLIATYDLVGLPGE